MTSRRLFVVASTILLSLGIACRTASRGVDPHVSALAQGDAVALGFSQAKLAEIRTTLSDDVRSGKIPGAYLLIARHGQIAFNEGFGVQGPGQVTPMTDSTIFRIFSMTKPIVTVAAMTFVEEGKLNIGDPVSRYLPEFANVKVLQADGSTRPAQNVMLVRHLMSHTSGLIYGFIQPNRPLAKLYASGGEDRTDITTREYARLIAALPLAAEPGTAWNYSRATDVLGAVVEVVAGKSLDLVVKERVTGPLGMTDTDFFQPATKANRFAQPAVKNALYYDYTVRVPFLAGGSGMSSTPEDYLRFALMLAGVAAHATG
jgi:CubicO group peptidase (beta-lactamase class C family)